MTTPRVMVVDDDADLRELICEYLTANGYEVCGAANSREMDVHLAQGEFDCIVLDLMMPEEDGLAILRRMHRPNRPAIIMLSALGSDTDRIVGLELGADDYLPKPFEPRELLARLRAILRRSEREQSGRGESVLRFGRLEIDCDTYQVRLDGEPRTLTAHQFALLSLLARHAGRVLSRDWLLDALHGSRAEGFDRSIDVHVSKLRAAIEDDPKRPQRILTLRGAGYVFARTQD